jgi:hypothetical protein
MEKTVRNLLGNISRSFSEDRVFDRQGGENGASVYLFFSVDLINSTLFKTVNPHTWATVFKDFYDMIGAQVKKAYINAEVWKYVGDEVLFYIKARSLSDVFTAPSMLYMAMVKAQEIFFAEHTHAERSLYMKSALWIASVSDSKQMRSTDSAPNISTTLSTGLDFIGVDIDEGFRMSKNAAQGKLVLDPKIVYLLSKHIDEWRGMTEENIADQVRHIGFEFLKGVWGGRAYPVIWYCDRWDDPDLFLYDEHYTNPLVKEYLSSGGDQKANTGYIQKIFKDLGFPEWKAEQIEDILKIDRISVSDGSGSENSSDLYHEAVCYDAVHNRALVVENADRAMGARQFIYLQK